MFTVITKVFDVDPQIKDMIDSYWQNFNLPLGMDYCLVGNNNLKAALKLNKLSESYQLLIGSDIMITVNESILLTAPEDIQRILIEQELHRIEFNLDRGTFKIKRLDLSSLPALTQRHSPADLIRAQEYVNLALTVDEEAEQVSASGTNSENFDRLYDNLLEYQLADETK